MFGPVLLEQLELHKLRWTPIQKGAKLKSARGFEYRILSVNGDKVRLKRMGVRKSYRGPTIFLTSIQSVEKRLTVVS